MEEKEDMSLRKQKFEESPPDKDRHSGGAEGNHEKKRLLAANTTESGKDKEGNAKICNQ